MTDPDHGPLPTFPGCYVCGAGHPRRLNVRFTVEEGGRVATRLPTDESHQGFPGVVHGGVLASLLDETMGWAPAVRHGRFAVSAEISIRYLRPVPVGTVLLATGEATAADRRLWEARGEIRGEDGTVYARGRGKYFPLSEEETRAVVARMNPTGEPLPLPEALARHRATAGSRSPEQ